MQSTGISPIGPGVAAAKVIVEDTEDTTTFVGLLSDATGNLPLLTDEQLTYNAATGELTAVGFIGALDGIVGGNTPAAGTFAALVGTTIDGPLGSVTPATIAGTSGTLSGNLAVAGIGPHSLGAAVNADYGINISPSFIATGGGSLGIAAFFATNLTGAVGNTAILANVAIAGTMATQDTDTNIGVAASLYLGEPNITNNLASAGKPDIAASLHIAGAPTEGDVNSAIDVAAGDISTDGGTYTMLESTTPSARTNYGKLYCKADNKLYFQDGAGSEHEVSFV